MLSRIRGSTIAQRLRALGPGFVDSFLRDNKVLPPVLAVLALLIFSWVVAGLFIGEPEEERVSNQANVIAQSPEQAQDDGDPGTPAPEVESRDADSYAAYQSKDPFRQLFTPPDSGETTGAEPTAPDGGGAGGITNGGGGGGATTGGGGGSRSGAQDPDNDGLNNRREDALGQDPSNPDTDGDGILDGQDDSDGDGIPDGSGGGSTNGGGGGAGGGLFDSGGTLY